MAEILLVGISVALVAALVVHEIRTSRAVLASIAQPATTPHQCDTEAVRLELEALEARTLEDSGRLRLAIAEGIERVDRAEKRVQKTVSSARKLVRENGLEHAGLEAEYSELLERDGEASPAVELPALPEPVVDDRPTGIPGISRAELNRITEALSA